MNKLLNVTCVLERELLARHFVHNPLAVVIAEPTAQFIVIHSRLVLAGAPELGDLLREDDPELVASACPLYHVLLVGGE